MKNIVILMLITGLFAACSNDKQVAVAKKEIISETPGRLEDLSKIDTGQFYKDFPQARNVNILGTLYQTSPPEQRMYAFKSRVFFGISSKDENSFGAKLNAMVNNSKDAEKILEVPQIAFKEGSTELTGKNTDEWKVLTYLSHYPVTNETMFTAKLNVNTENEALRKQRLEVLKTTLEASKADINRFTFNEKATPQSKEGILSIEIEKVEVTTEINPNVDLVTPKK